MMQTLLYILSLVAGAAVGWCLPVFDKIAYIFILHPEAQVSQYLKYQLEKRQYKNFWQTLRLRTGEIDKLTTRGILFQVVWLVLAIFALTSVAGIFGKVLVLALGLRVFTEEWQEWFKDRAMLEKKLLWQIKADWQEKEIKGYLIIKTILMAWLCLMLVR